MIKLSFLNLFRRKSRTFLSVLGIAIGVAAIIGLMSVVDGVTQEYQSIIGGMQGVWAWEKDVADNSLSRLDASYGTEIASMQGVRVVVPELWLVPTSVDGKPLSLSEASSISSIPSIYAADLTAYNKLRSNIWIGEIAEGSMLKPGDSGYVLIGQGIKENMHKYVGSTIKLNDKKFRVKGILKTESEMFSGIIFMSIEDGREISGTPSDIVHTFFAELQNPAEDQAMAQKMEFRMGDKIDFMTTSDLSSVFSDILGSFDIVAVLIGGLAAFVAGVGIINTILMSVLERTKEIGSMMAAGWTGGDVMKMVLYESVFIGMLGGIAGIILGFGVSEAAKGYGIPSVVTTTVIINSFVFAMALGLAAGIYPAWRASKMNPVEAISGG
ncbi:MAG: ABC transporter permease [Candidatus Diapherotrites archaeon]|nr:ABC transporter permease [Candidatus Diapherotrites archaeon]